ncbi:MULTISPECIES: hypothetical protein [unclassified Lysobacter]|uniref:hypothetical protein n=1 Tax=unclassified Lysobacter TaxID=2635362 RepID=UPI001BE8B3E1|nr:MULTISPECIES: hypothetical protein [unclassified Lysobacter]MBT2747817.1 hypothetical protein [Lysobacter sp. ISL-42]MBT2751461.1 hypothetical protein [Lysobacter sp. ISL-50]MBT2778230.1 hypothetical protein [Lysobacter sp. ISL-54]MBT2782723.1 hypothetical protein [Lysobacter sp. ISL-52]
MEVLAATLGIEVTQRVAAEPSDASESTLMTSNIGMSGIDFVYRYAARRLRNRDIGALPSQQQHKKSIESASSLACRTRKKWSRRARVQSN